ncbi:axoneme-associated protein mst101(1) [Drosophila obscura]|uniref:axoneme-associated protein mst101(1) n=1 Tax=Drosophila obscura TaxID=7282 RepID=UPI001BB0E2D6|nr:axoneme-associated protein mst101(1) [Drosophila obscura]
MAELTDCILPILTRCCRSTKNKSLCAKRSINPCPLKTCKGEEKKSCEQPSQLCHPPKKTYPLLAYHSYTIRNKYPEQLVTYDGQARCEQRLIRISDLTESYLTLVFEQVAEEVRQQRKRRRLERKKRKSCAAKKESKGQAKAKSCRKKRSSQKCPQKAGSCAEKKSSEKCIEIKNEGCGDKQKECCGEKEMECCAEKRESCGEVKRECCPKKEESCEEEKAQPRSLQAMIRSEIRANRLYEMELCRGRKEGKPWLSLMPREKLPYYCRGLNGERLRATAYSNFQQSFVRRFRQMHPRACPKRVRAETRARWYALDCCQRLPFVMLAFVYHVSTGALDPLDQCAVRAMYRKLKGTD